jgi:hypothetical protein
VVILVYKGADNPASLFSEKLPAVILAAFFASKKHFFIYATNPRSRRDSILSLNGYAATRQLYFPCHAMLPTGRKLNWDAIQV